MTFNIGIPSHKTRIIHTPILPGGRPDIESALMSVLKKTPADFCVPESQRVSSGNTDNINGIAMEQLGIPPVPHPVNAINKRPICNLEQLDDVPSSKVQRTQEIEDLGGITSPSCNEFLSNFDPNQNIENDSTIFVESDFLTLCKLEKLKISLILELPKMALAAIKEANKGLTDIKIAKYFPENIRVEIVDNTQIITHKDDIQCIDEYQAPLSEARSSYHRYKNIYSVGKMIDKLMIVANIQDSELVELKQQMLLEDDPKTRIKPDKALTRITAIQLKFHMKEEGIPNYVFIAPTPNPSRSYKLPQIHSLKFDSPFMQNILDKQGIRAIALELQSKWFLDSDLKLYQKLELPIRALEKMQRSGELKPIELLDLIPENTLVDFENGTLRFYSKREYTEVPEKYFPSKLQDEYQVSNKYTIGVMLETIKGGKEADYELEILICLLKQVDSPISFNDAVKRLKKIQTKLIKEDQYKNTTNQWT